MIDFKDLIDLCRAESLNDFMEPTESSVWMSICRDYSVKFNTPLHIVANELDPRFVIKNLYASQLDKVDIDEDLEYILDLVYTLADPNYSKEKLEEQQRFDEQAEADEKERQESGESLLAHLWRKSKKKPLKKKAKTQKSMAETTLPNPKLPKSGGINMEKLQHLAAEEAGSSGFDEES